MTLIRTKPPEIQRIAAFEVKEAVERQLDNGLRVYVINAGDDEVLRLEFLFPTGCASAHSYMETYAAITLADAGTSKRSADEIAEGFDYYGSWYNSAPSTEVVQYHLYTTNRFFAEALPLFYEVISDPVYPQREISSWKQRSLQHLAVNREKTSWICRRNFHLKLFGPDSPYGFHAVEDDYTRLTDSGIIQQSHKYRAPGQAMIALSGKVTTEALKVLGSLPVTYHYIPEFIIPFAPIPAINRESRKLHIEKENSVQSTVMIGKRTISKNHPDFIPLTILNTLFGGYFGSRLMSNVREDKGYTYSIHSNLQAFRNESIFSIFTETGKEVTGKAVDEIYREMDRLRNVTVPHEELELVKNYIVGRFLRGFDGPFAQADFFKNLKFHGLEYNYLKNYLTILNNLEPTDLTKLAQKYFDPETMIEVVVG